MSAAFQRGRAEAAEQHSTQLAEIEARAERIREEAEAEGRAHADIELLRTADDLRTAPEETKADIDQRLADEISRVPTPKTGCRERRITSSGHNLPRHVRSRSAARRGAAGGARRAHRRASGLDRRFADIMRGA